MESFTNNEVISITNFWGTKRIPAILRKNTNCMFPGWSDVWIPDGYENGGGGYSTRNCTEIKKFEGTDEVRNDVIKQWEEERKICNSN
jgi:hypothetical protein